MSKKTPETAKLNNGLPLESASDEAFTELEQLRLIVFGQAKAELESKIDALQQDVRHDIDILSSQINLRFADLNDNIQKQHAALTASIESLTTIQLEDKNVLIEHTKALESQLSSQIEMTENAGKDDADQIHKRIDDEVAKLEAGLDNTMQELLAQLEQVSKKLSSSKTDRKSLAQMLANMASNLEEDA